MSTTRHALTAEEIARADELLELMRERTHAGADLSRTTVLRAALARGFAVLERELLAAPPPLTALPRLDDEHPPPKSSSRRRVELVPPSPIRPKGK